MINPHHQCCAHTRHPHDSCKLHTDQDRTHLLPPTTSFAMLTPNNTTHIYNSAALSSVAHTPATLHDARCAWPHSTSKPHALLTASAGTVQCCSLPAVSRTHASASAQPRCLHRQAATPSNGTPAASTVAAAGCTRWAHQAAPTRTLQGRHRDDHAGALCCLEGQGGLLLGGLLGLLLLACRWSTAQPSTHSMNQGPVSLQRAGPTCQDSVQQFADMARLW